LENTAAGFQPAGGFGPPLGGGLRQLGSAAPPPPTPLSEGKEDRRTSARQAWRRTMARPWAVAASTASASCSIRRRWQACGCPGAEGGEGGGRPSPLDDPGGGSSCFLEGEKKGKPGKKGGGQKKRGPGHPPATKKTSSGRQTQTRTPCMTTPRWGGSSLRAADWKKDS